ncbi:MAG: hypothetical protein HY959_03585 [Ignavibacteriae bacterium]|nr:hypothetical protein [Ignavibacteriota bacterium]
MHKIRKKETEKTVVKENPVFNYILLAAFAIFLCYFTTFKITGDDDVFWHLATGKHILETHHVPSTDIFGYMTQGQEWMPFEWGWDVITYSIYSFSGYNGLSVFRTILFLLIFFIYFLILRKFNINYTLIFISLFFLAFGIIDRLSPRPHIMSYLAFVLLLLIIVQYRYVNRQKNSVLFFIPLIFLVWANMHMGIIAGMFLLGIWVLSEIIIFIKPNKFSSKDIPALTKPELVRLLLIFAASVLVMFVNPNFYQTYLYAYNHTKMKMLETINEWMSPFSNKYSDSFVSVIYKTMLFLGVLILYYAGKKKDLFSALLYIGFAVYSVRAMRFTVDYVLIIFIFLVITIDFILNMLKSEKFKSFLSASPVPKIILSVFFIFLAVNVNSNDLYLKFLKYYRVTGFGINSDFIPTQMFGFMKENKVPEIGDRIFNHFGTGGFFVWNFPGKQNFIDSRNLNDDIFYKYNQILAKQPGFEQKLNEYGIEYSIYLAPDLVRGPQEMEQTVISFFCKSKDWKLIFWDDKSFLFVKNIPKFADLINKYEYKYLTPYSVIYQKSQFEKGITEDKVQLKKEIDRKMAEEPKGVVLNTALRFIGNKLN